MARSLAAYTTTSPIYPPFINIVEDAGDVRVTVRSEPALQDGRVLMPGAQAAIVLPRNVAIAQLREALAGLEAQ